MANLQYGTPLSFGAKGDWNKKGEMLTYTPKKTNNEPLWTPVYPPAPDYSTDFSDLFNRDLAGLTSGGGGGYSVNPIDLTPMIDAYNQAATAQKNTIQQNVASRRQDLLTSIKRFQEDTVRNQELQRQNYMAGRADLEEAAFMADRANRASAAARGIGGSGLQQLAQLQNLLAQGKEINTLAKENINVQADLRRQLAEKQEDTDTAIQDLLASEANQLAAIDADTASAIANLQYQERVRQEEARQNAAAAASNYNLQLAQYQNELNSKYGTGIGLLQSEEIALADNLIKANSLSGKKKKEAQEIALQNALDNINYIANGGEYGLNSSYYTTARQRINALYNQKDNVNSLQSWLNSY